MGGTFDMASALLISASTSTLRGWLECGSWWAGCLHAVGSWGTGCNCSLWVVVVAESSGLFWFHRRLLVGVGEYRPYFENYTVDASIFDMTFRGCVVLDDLKDH